MPNIDRIFEAIADLESQKVPDLTTTAKKYGVVRRTLEIRWLGKTVSMEEAVSTHRQCLTNSQERALVELINKLTVRKMPPTSAIVKNLAEEIRGCAVGKNWTASFVHRHQHELKSAYLKSMDSKRFKSEFPPVYKAFYKLVASLFALLFVLYY